MVESIEVERRAPFGDSPAVGPRGTRTQRRILRAALAVFAEHGYHDSSIERITEAAGCSRPTFYQYFSSKEDVFRALASFVGRALVEMTERLGPVTPDAEGRAALVAWMREFAAFYDEYAPVFTGFSAAVRSDTGLAGASSLVSAGFGRALRSSLDIGLDGRAPDADQDVMARIVVTMIVRANLLRRGMTGLVSRKRFIESLAALVHRVLLGAVPALDDGEARRGTTRPVRLRARARAGAAELQSGPSTDRRLSPQGKRMRTRIMEAGTSVFPRLGFHETRVDDVVDAAGASHGSFYRYFDSKDDLFRALATEAATKLLACIEAFPVEDEPAALHRWLDQWFSVYAEHGGIIAIWRESQFPDPVLEDLTRRVAEAALDRLLAALGDRVVGDRLVNAMALLGLIETVPHHVHAFGYFNQSSAVDALVTVIRRGFLGLDP